MRNFIIKLALPIMCISMMACGNNEKHDTQALYNDLLQEVISGDEMFSDEGEGYGFTDAESPGYALYDIDKDGTEELFITPRKDSEWHTYTVYYIEDGAVKRGRALNGYLPDENLWTYSFDFFIEAYKFSSKDGFTRQWEFDYPWVDGIAANTLYYEGQEPKEISDEELEELLSGHITEPSDIKWIPLGTGSTDKDSVKDAVIMPDP